MDKESTGSELVTVRCGLCLFKEGECMGSLGSAWRADRKKKEEGRLDAVDPMCLVCLAFGPVGVNFVWDGEKRIPIEQYKSQQEQAQLDGTKIS